MKHIIKHLIIGAFIGGLSQLFASCPINISNPKINPKPLSYPGTGHITFEVLEDGGRIIPAKDSFGDPTCKFNVSMQNVTLKDKNTLNITGDIKNYFDISFNEAKNRVYFIQKLDYPADHVSKEDIAITVTKASTSAEKSNGFQLNVYASNVEGSEFTYTTTTGKKPDFKPILTVYGGIVHGAGVHAFSFDALIRDLITDSTYDSSKPLTITIPKNKALKLTFDATETSFKGQAVENKLWTFDDTDSFDYILTYKGTSMPTHKSRFSVHGTLTVKEGEVSKFFLETTIKSGTGGDSNIDNNSDRETLEKRL